MPVLFGILKYMGKEQGITQPNENERYAQFAKGQKHFAAEIGERTLDVAQHGKAAKESDLESIQRQLESHQQKMEQLRDDIDAKKRNVITKIMNFKQLKELKKKLNREQTIVQKYEEEQKWRAEMIGYYDRIIEEEEAMGQLMEEAQTDNEVFDTEKKVEMMEEEKGRSVMEQAKKHNVFFVSDIVTAEWKPSANNRALNTKELDFEDQLDIILGLEPTLSVSTLAPDSKNRTFGNGAMGVLLSGGHIVGGETNDAGTVAMGLRSRYIDKRSRTVEAIDKAIGGRYGGKTENSSYNELVVEQPEVAGIYFKLDAEDIVKYTNEDKEVLLPKAYGDAWWEERIGVMVKTGVPIFVIEQDTNKVRLVHTIDIKRRSFKVTPAYDPENMVDMPGIYKQHLDAEHKRVSVTKVFDKTAHLLIDEEREQHEREKDKGNSTNFINVY